jgi:hypothetical protein
LCKDCHHQFLAESNYSQEGRKSETLKKVTRALVRGTGIRDIRAIFLVSFAVIYKILNGLKYSYVPKKKYYHILEIDEFWTYVAKKTNKIWLIYAYDRETGEIVAHVWGEKGSQDGEKAAKKDSKARHQL